ncbi:hypothetical protein B0J14DRAFT_651590 [Halenospora varia]|nr:hypothetical protein B0J14DRAFT_651590 [Halenospora varia]
MCANQAYWAVCNLKSGTYLDLQGASGKNGTTIFGFQRNDPNKQPNDMGNQEWAIEEYSHEGYFTTTVQSWTKKNTDNKPWQFWRVSRSAIEIALMIYQPHSIDALKITTPDKATEKRTSNRNAYL